MGPDTFVGLTEDKLQRIAELPYTLLAKQISEKENVDISVKVKAKFRKGNYEEISNPAVLAY